MSKLRLACIVLSVLATSAAAWWFYPILVSEDPFAVDGPPIAIEGLTVAECLQFNANSKGVTAENNLGLILLQVTEPSQIELRRRDTLLQILQVSSLPKRGRFFPAFEEETYTGEIGDDDFFRPAMYPWAPADRPEMAKFIEENKSVLDRFLDTQERDHFYIPMLRNMDPELNGMLNTKVHIELAGLRIASGLCARAQLRSKRGETEAALQDFLAAWRLSLLLQRTASVILVRTPERITYASKGIRRIVRIGNLSDDRLKQLATEIDTLPPAPSRRAIIERERCIIIDGIKTCVDRTGTGRSMPEYMADLWDAADKTMVEEKMNSLFDDYVAAFADEDRDRSKRRLDEIVNRAKAWNEGEGDETRPSCDLEDKAAINDWLAENLCSHMLPHHGQMDDTFCNTITQFRLTRLVVALERFKKQHASYPRRMTDLVQDYLPAPLLDPTTGKPLTYGLKRNGTYVAFPDRDFVLRDEPDADEPWEARKQHFLRSYGLRADPYYDNDCPVR